VNVSRTMVLAVYLQFNNIHKVALVAWPQQNYDHISIINVLRCHSMLNDICPCMFCFNYGSLLGSSQDGHRGLNVLLRCFLVIVRSSFLYIYILYTHEIIPSSQRQNVIDHLPFCNLAIHFEKIWVQLCMERHLARNLNLKWRRICQILQF